jgi:TetR/AcrR family transcriptional regulator, cholesterol catabolism regulator
MAKIVTAKNTSKKEVILQHAASLFKTNSYSATSMRELATLVGVEAPSLYNHIGSKSELLQTICFKMGHAFVAQVNDILQSNLNSVEKIEAIIRFHISTMLQNFDEVYVANHEWKHLKEPYLKEFLEIRRHYEKSLITVIETGIQQQEIKPINSYVVALTILSAVRGLEFWYRNKKAVSQQTLEDDMVNHLLKGIVN